MSHSLKLKNLAGIPIAIWCRSVSHSHQNNRKNQIILKSLKKSDFSFQKLMIFFTFHSFYYLNSVTNNLLCNYWSFAKDTDYWQNYVRLWSHESIFRGAWRIPFAASWITIFINWLSVFLSRQCLNEDYSSMRSVWTTKQVRHLRNSSVCLNYTAEYSVHKLGKDNF